MATANDFDDARRAHGDGAIVRAIESAKRCDGITATPYEWRDPWTLKPREWVYGRSIQRGHVRAVVAQGGAGKTILSVGEALAMVTGRNLLGQQVPGGPKRVWLWNLEDDSDELARIIQAACKHWDIARADIAGRLFVDSALEGAILKLATSGPDGFSINRPLVGALTDELRTRGIDYLHVDPFVSSHSANESDNMEIDAIAKEWAMVAKNARAGVGLAHHVSKAGAADATALSARGAVALINACRSVLVLNRMSEDEAKRYGFEDEKRRRYFRVYDDKNNRAPPSDKSDWYQMFSVILGNGENDDGDNMGVVVPWSPPDAFDGVTVDHLRRVQAVVASGIWWKDSQSIGWVGEAVADVMGLNADKNCKADRARIAKLLATWYATGALKIEDAVDPKSRKLRPAVVVGVPAVDGAAPPAKGGAEQAGAGRAPEVLHHHPSPVREGVVQAARRNENQVEQRAPIFTAGNPDGRRSRVPILAPGEEGDDVEFT